MEIEPLTHEQIAEVRRLWQTTHKDRPLSIAVRMGVSWRQVYRSLGPWTTARRKNGRRVRDVPLVPDAKLRSLAT